MPLVGAHESVAGGLHLAFDRLRQAGGEALQIFTRNQRQWHPQALTAEEIALFQQAWKESGALPVSSHASYLINLASGKQELIEKSITAFAGEINRCAKLGVPFVVIHPGSHGGDGVEVGLVRFARALDLALAESEPGVTVLLETTAGQGSSLGHRFEHLATIIEGIDDKARVAVCLDTCHVFAAGYDIGTAEGAQATLRAFDKTIGLKRLVAIHINDSVKGLGSRVDRHAHIGQGLIGGAGLAALLTDKRLAKVPFLLETPKGEDLAEDRMNLAALRALAGQS